MKNSLLCLLCAVFLTGCLTINPTSTPSESPLDLLTETANAQTSEMSLLLPTDWRASQDCSNQACIFNGYFLLQNPIPQSANQAVDGSYRFGTTQEGLREIHHGVEFGNPSGTPVLAAWYGKVIHAGDDSLLTLGLTQNFYGKVVVIEHDPAGLDQPLFTLYAHLSEITVKVDEAVTAGEQIGSVGRSGAAIGSHLHFEVRLGENTYQAAVNPELWLAPVLKAGSSNPGALAGIIRNTGGEAVRVPNIRLEYSLSEGGSVAKYLTLSTYYDDRVKSDPSYGENFAISELAPGWYRITMIAGGKYYSKWIQIEAGKLSFLSILIE